MLSIKDLNGVDLTLNSPEETALSVAGYAETVQASVTCAVIEDDPLLLDMFVNGTLDWNDGSTPTIYAAESGTLSVDAVKGLGHGTYIVSVQGQNYAAPTPNCVRVNFPFSVTLTTVDAPAQRLIFGPILPRDNGSPNTSQWDFNSDSDLLILESSIRMLLLTNKGERIMEPAYGTNIRRILFELNLAGIESAISEEITSAITTWEPRVKLKSISVVRNRDKSVSVSTTFLTRLNSQPFDVNLEFVR